MGETPAGLASSRQGSEPLEWNGPDLAVERPRANTSTKKMSWTGRTISWIGSNRRYVLVPLAVNLARVVMALILYFVHSSSGVFRTTYMDWQYAGGPLGEPFQIPVPKGHWSYLFFGWDSIWYMRIAWVGYYGTRFAFFPILPLVLRFFYTFTMDFGVAAAIVSFLFGTIWIPFYQAVAERYMDRDKALLNTFLCAFFPYVFLFTSVAYTEAIFMFACTAAWYFYLKDKLPHSFLMVAVATVTRIYGALMLLPILMDLASKQKWRETLYSLIPAFSLFLWCYYCYIYTGDWLAFRTVQVAYWGSPTLFTVFIGRFLTGMPIDWSLYHTFILAFIAVILYLTLASWEVDRRLGLFAFVGVVANLFMGYIWSYTRHLTFFFPAWLVARPSNKYIVGVVCLVFMLCSIVLWNQFIMRQWVA